MPSTVLIVTDEVDAHADMVVLELSRRGVPVFRFHPEDFPRASGITLGVREGRLTGRIVTPRRSLDLADVCAVWYRRPAPVRLSDDVDPAAAEYALTQARDLLQALYAGLDTLWVGDPHLLRRAEVKALQLRRAHEAGLRTPPTLISNVPRDVSAFVRPDIDRWAVKPLEVIGVAARDGFRFPLTTTVAAGDPLAGVQLAPSIFQPYLAKEAELRCVVIDDEVFCGRIDSQAEEATSVDWRRGDPPHERYDLPRDVEHALRRLVRSFQLNFSSVDLVLTPDGEFVFLDLNPNGQWLWLELELELPLVSRMCDLLTKHAARPARAG